MHTKKSNFKSQNAIIQEAISIHIINARSIRNKTTLLREYCEENNADIMIFTETWLNGDDTDLVITAEISPENYLFKHRPRKNQVGGGVGVLYKKVLKIIEITTSVETSTFEHMEIKLVHQTSPISIGIVYKPPHSSGTLFMSEFDEYISELHLQNERIMITGDLNIHIDSTSNRKTLQLTKLLDNCNLIQHIKSKTHISGHILDVLITSAEVNIANIDVGPNISDHCPISCLIYRKQNQNESQINTFRNYKRINFDMFQQDLQNSKLLTEPANNIEDYITQFNQTISNVINVHAPLKVSKCIPNRQNKWFNDEIKEARQVKRRAEITWRQNKSDHNRNMYNNQRNKLTCLIDKAKRSYYNEQICANEHNPKVLFKTMNSLLNKNQNDVLPSHTTAKELANRFANFFETKITTIHENIKLRLGNTTASQTPAPRNDIEPLTRFISSDEEIKTTISVLATNHVNLIKSHQK